MKYCIKIEDGNIVSLSPDTQILDGVWIDCNIAVDYENPKTWEPLLEEVEH